MHKVKGFTIIEIVIALAVMSVLVALATPSIMNSMQSASVRSAAEFYAEGLQMARIEAIRRNASARFVLGTPDANGWSVDWCQASTGQPCNAGGAWTNVVQRSGAAYDALTLNFCPGGSTEIDFTSVGWVNTQANIPLGAIRVTPSNSEIRSSQVEIPLSGIPVVCTPGAAAGDSRVCQVACP
jgi:prepilin-type N-terminal cleavage/methylation domain-containing protein